MRFIDRILLMNRQKFGTANAPSNRKSEALMRKLTFNASSENAYANETTFIT